MDISKFQIGQHVQVVYPARGATKEEIHAGIFIGFHETSTDHEILMYDTGEWRAVWIPHESLSRGVLRAYWRLIPTEKETKKQEEPEKKKVPEIKPGDIVWCYDGPGCMSKAIFIKMVPDESLSEALKNRHVASIRAVIVIERRRIPEIHDYIVPHEYFVDTHHGWNSYWTHEEPKDIS